MKLFATAYDTTVCSGYVLDKLREGIQLSLVKGDLAFARIPNTRVFQVKSMGAVSSAIPEFAHPFPFEHNGEKCLAIDVRPFGHYDRTKGDFVVRNPVEYELLVHRAKLNDLWLSDDWLLLRDVSPMAMQYFASWIAENVARRFGLDPKEQLNLAILAGFHYLCLFLPDEQLDEQTKLKMVAQISRAVRCSAQDVLHVLDEQHQPCLTIVDFCAEAKNATKSVRLQEFSPGILISIIKSTWFGVHSQEMLGVATEHPPTWLALLLAAHVERTYKNMSLSKLVERGARTDGGQQFVRSVLRLTQLATV
jgi:hypothetical protein